MTIGQKIIFSSTLVALLAALAAYMGWKNTQPIQQGLVKSLTHTTEEIRFLDDIEGNVKSIKSEILELLDKIVKEADDAERYSAEGKLINTRIKTLKLQIKAFSEFNQVENQEEIIRQMLEMSSVFENLLPELFKNENTLPSNRLAIQTEITTRKVVDEFETLILESNQQRFSSIKYEGENVKAQISKLNFWIILVGGLTFLMAIVFGQIIAYNLSQSLDQLKNAAKQLKEGNYATRVGLKSKDEFGKLGETFNQMASGLEQAKIIETQKLEVEHLNEQLKTKNDSLDRFVYRVSHDLKAPILNIKSLLQLVQTKVDTETNPEVRQSFVFLEKSSNKLQQTIFDLLEVSRIEKSLHTTKEWIKIEEIVQKVEKDNKQSILETSTQIVCDFKVEEIFFSKTHLNSILSNLITNSIKYQSKTQTPEIHISTNYEKDLICLKVEDNGIGINLEKHGSKLFGMFNRFHNHVDGSGVGLYIVKKIIEEAGGSIEVESQPGLGTSFSLYFKQEEIPADYA